MAAFTDSTWTDFALAVPTRQTAPAIVSGFGRTANGEARPVADFSCLRLLACD